jgi:dienelactone hydrolase
MGTMTTIKIPVEDGTSLPAHLARPATDPAPVGVIVAHELFGVNPDIRGVAGDLAGSGFLTIAPEFYHRDAAPGRWLERDDAGQLPRGRARVLLAGHAAIQPGGSGGRLAQDSAVARVLDNTPRIGGDL